MHGYSYLNKIPYNINVQRSENQMALWVYVLYWNKIKECQDSLDQRYDCAWINFAN